MRLRLFFILFLFHFGLVEIRAETCLASALRSSLWERHIGRLKKYLDVDQIVVLPNDALRGSKGVFFPGEKKIAISEKMLAKIDTQGRGVLRHEARHAYFLKLLREGKVTPYHGHLKIVGEGTSSLEGLKNSGYNKYVSFEELLTHSEDTRYNALALKRALEKNQREEIAPLIENLLFNAQAGKQISKGILEELTEIKASIRPQTITSRDRGLGKELVYRSGEEELSFFVTGLKGSDEEIFLSQLDQAIEAAKKALEKQNRAISIAGAAYVDPDGLSASSLLPILSR